MNRKRTKITTLTLTGALAAAFLLLLIPGAQAGSGERGPATRLAPGAVVSNTLSFQGQLLDSNSNPVNGPTMMTFRLYAGADDSVPLWTKSSSVEVNGGLFNAHLDVDAALFDGQALWLGVQVAGDAEEMEPRQPLLPVPYALYALGAPWSGLSGIPEGFADGADDVMAVVSGTNVFAGEGLNQVSSGDSVTMSVATTYRLPQGCGGGQVARWNLAGWWECHDDSGGEGFWSLTGNAGTSPGVHFVGTTDPVSLTLAVGGMPALRLEPSFIPNFIGGHAANQVWGGVAGATIGGGGGPDDAHRVTDNHNTVGGGAHNYAGNDDDDPGNAPAATVAGGAWNSAGAGFATVGGGGWNSADGEAATVGGGWENTAVYTNATVGGGGWNAAVGWGATVGGGEYNAADSGWSTIAGGDGNHAAMHHSAIGGGYANQALGPASTVGGGQFNTASGEATTVGGGEGNTAGVGGDTVGGGLGNNASGGSATIGGGMNNRATAGATTIGGGEHIYVAHHGATVAGGSHITATGDYAAVGGGRHNNASGNWSTIGGGGHHTATWRATVGGGWVNKASGDYATVGGGRDNTASGNSATVGGGIANEASGYGATIGGGWANKASGGYATVPGGNYNTAQGSFSFAAGQRAQANHDGAFVWADSIPADFASSGDNQFLVRATGGVNFETGDAPFQINGDNVWQPSNMVVVAKSGGDYTSVQGAIDSIGDAAPNNPYLVWVAPGVYHETVRMMPYVHLQGAGQEATVITSPASDSSWPPQATLVLTHHVSLRDLTVGNNGVGDYNTALLATSGVSQTLVADVTARAQGGGAGRNFAVVLSGFGTAVTLQDVTALGENGSNVNYGLFNGGGAAATLRGGSFTARGGIDAQGIYNSGSDTTLQAESVTALGANGSDINCGLCNSYNAAATLHGGSFTARGGTSAEGIYNFGDTTLQAESVTALGENGSANYGLYNLQGAEATLRGGSFTGRGDGTYALGIGNNGSGTTLQAENITAIGEGGGTYIYGLYNYYEAAADVTQSVLQGGANGSIRRDSGSVMVSNSRLVGGALLSTIDCVAVTWGTMFYGGPNCP